MRNRSVHSELRTQNFFLGSGILFVDLEEIREAGSPEDLVDLGANMVQDHGHGSKEAHFR